MEEPSGVGTFSAVVPEGRAYLGGDRRGVRPATGWSVAPGFPVLAASFLRTFGREHLTPSLGEPCPQL